MSQHGSNSPEHESNSDGFSEQIKGLGTACVVAVLAGVLTGAIGAAFRAGLSWIGALHVRSIEWAHAWPLLGWVLPLFLGAIGAGVARLLVRPQPLASGSGVQDVEAIMRGQGEPPSIWLVPVKFFGGLIGIGSGLALGREGPTIQMGATTGGQLARLFKYSTAAIRDLQAALGGAGLAVAFNAPVGGALFVFEEVAHAFRLRLSVVTLIGSATAIAVARIILGGAPDFDVSGITRGAPWIIAIYALFGFLLGLLAVLYNKLTIYGLDALANLSSWPQELRAALVGAVVGVVAWFGPDLVGGGDDISQRILNGGVPLSALLLIFAVRWFLGPWSYSAGTPGGLFSPLLLVGAVLGALFVTGFNALAPSAYALPLVSFAIVGMVAFFAGVVRAPFTGIVLIAEMTATTTLMVPMLAAAFGAMLSASLVRGAPIYDTLRIRMLRAPESPH